MWEFVIQIVGEFLIELGWNSVAEPFRNRARGHPLLAAVGAALIGALLGALSVQVLPRRVFGVTGVPGASLVLAPLANGVAMEAYGRWREAKTGRRSYFATFWSGALFAFAMAFTRFSLIEP